MIHVIAVITGKPGMRDSILQAFRANVPVVKAEKGCIEYGAAVDADNAVPFQTKWGADTTAMIWQYYMSPFLIGDAVKAVLATMIVIVGWSELSQRKI